MAAPMKISILVSNIDKANDNLTDEHRKSALTGFFNQLQQNPEFILLQEVQNVKETQNRQTIKEIKQIEYLRDALKPKNIYLHIEEEEGSSNEEIEKDQHGNIYRKVKSFNTIMHIKEKNFDVGTKTQIWPDPDPEVSITFEKQSKILLHTSRFCIGQFTVQENGVKLLLVCFHGHHKSLTIPEKRINLRYYLRLFQKVKESSKSNFLIVGGDFNLDLDDFEELEKFEKFEPNILNELGLKIIPYNPQRLGADGKKKKKVDGLICDERLLLKPMEVTVFHHFPKDCKIISQIKETANKKKEVEIVECKDKCSSMDFEEDATNVVCSHVPAEILDHDPVLFTLWIPTLENLPNIEKLNLKDSEAKKKGQNPDQSGKGGNSEKSKNLGEKKEQNDVKGSQ